VRFEEIKTGVGVADIVSAKSELVVGSTIIEVMLVLFAGIGSSKVEFVTVAEDWIVVPAAVPLLIWNVMASALAMPPLASAAL
jgi:hypothetical protein